MLLYTHYFPDGKGDFNDLGCGGWAGYGEKQSFNLFGDVVTKKKTSVS